MQTKLQSLVFTVSDLGRAVEFYEGLDLKLIGRWDEDGIAFVDVGGAQLWLVATEETPPSYPVCIFRVADVEEARQRVEKLGGKIVSELAKDAMGSYYIFADPDGNQAEIRQPPARK